MHRTKTTHILTLKGLAAAALIGVIQVTSIDTILADSHGHKHGSHRHSMASQSDITIEAPFARATVSRAKNGVAYLTINNSGKEPDRLVAARADVAKRVELHTHVRDGDVMRMRRLEGIDLPANGRAELKPGSHHIMLMGLSSPLREGDEFPLTLVFANAGEIQVTVKIGPIAATGASHRGHGGHGKHAAHDRTDHEHMGELVVPVHQISAEGIGKQIGTIVLKDSSEGLMVIPNLHGLSPGKHGFHIHEKGDCGPGIKEGKAVAGLAAGPHYGHGSHGGHHGKPVGDLPELMAGADGMATTGVNSPHLKASEIAGRSIMIHAESEAAGSGARFACGIIPKLP